jgi:HAMP domain-containing protein
MKRKRTILTRCLANGLLVAIFFAIVPLCLVVLVWENRWVLRQLTDLGDLADAIIDVWKPGAK